MLALAACNSSDLDASAQGACSNLAFEACVANTACQPAFLEYDGVGGLTRQYFHCLAAEGDTLAESCPADHDACRATNNCSPVFHQDTVHDGPVGSPSYQRCELTVTLAQTTNLP